jgi:uncharacterized protein DUF349
MTLLDRFRTQSQKHADPAVRLAHLGEIPVSERDLIAAIAREDDDARVRRAAVAKLMDPAALGSILRDDPDESVQGQAATMLRDIALEAFEGVAEGDSLEAVDALTDVRVLAQIAKTAGREIVALRALSRISDTRVLGSIARQAGSEAARRGAFERLLGDKTEILAIAMNSEYKDSALAAVDAIGDRQDLEQIAARARNKSAAKRARSIVRDAEERAAREAAAMRDAGEAAAMREAGEAAAMRETSEAAVMGEKADVAARREATAAATLRDGLQAVPTAGGAGVSLKPDPTVEDRESESARAETDPARAEEEASRELVEQRETAASAERGRAQAAALEEARRVSVRRHARLAELVEVAANAAADADLASASRRFAVARVEWKDLIEGIVVDPTLAARFGAAQSQLTVREAEAKEADARARREALRRLQQLLGRVESLLAGSDIPLKAADRALRDVRAALGAVPPLPTKQDHDDVLGRLKAAQSVLMPKVHELREAEDWQRWANVGIQEQLCARMEALSTAADPDAIAREVRELQQQWRLAADVPRAQVDALWRRFKAAHDAVWARCEAYFAAEARERADNLAKKIALCEKAEALADSTRWIQTAEEIKRLQAEWKAIGPVSQGREKATWDRFRAACDRFFTRRHEDLAKLKTVWTENFARKEALCVSAEALAESVDWDRAVAEIKRLQAEWKTIGSVKKSRSEAIWQRFRGACDRFFTRYAQRHDIARAERIAAREAICAELEALAPEGEASAVAAEADAASASQGPPADLVSTVRAIRLRWQQELAARGVDPERARALDDRFAAASARVLSRWPSVLGGTDLDPEANRKRMESIVRRVEDLAASLTGPSAASAGGSALSPATRLAAMLKEALAANTIGGKVDDDSRWRAAAEEVRQAQASWTRIGQVPEEARRSLADRFQRACRRIMAGPGR